MSKIRPIPPTDVQTVKNNTIPDEVIEAFNSMIIKKWNGISSIVKQSDVLDMIVNEDEGRTSSYYFDNKFFDVEDIYRAQGWEVKYDKPAYCESYSATFEFRKASNE